MSDRKIKLPAKDDDDEETRDCYRCKLSKTLDAYRVRNKELSTLFTQCRQCEYEVSQQRRYTYGNTKKCLKCKEKLPIGCFWFKSTITGQREARCGKCIAKGRTSAQRAKRKATNKRWRNSRRGQAWKKAYYENYKERRNALHKERCRTDLSYRVHCLVRNRIYDALIRTGTRRGNKIGYLGMNAYLYNKWLEYQFDEHMTWENQGTYWHIDHVTPCGSFDFKIESDIYACFDWKNTRPMEKNANISKSDTVDPIIMRAHRKIVAEFIIHHFYNTEEFLYDGRDSYYTNELFGIAD